MNGSHGLFTRGATSSTARQPPRPCIMNTSVKWVIPLWPIFFEILTNAPEPGYITPNSLAIISLFRSTGLFLKPSPKLIQSLALFFTLFFFFNYSCFLLARLLEFFIPVRDVGFDDHSGEVAAVHDLHSRNSVIKTTCFARTLQTVFPVMRLVRLRRRRATYLHALIRSHSITIPHACYAIDFFVEENNVSDFAHLGAFFSDVFFDVKDGCWVFL